MKVQLMNQKKNKAKPIAADQPTFTSEYKENPISSIRKPLK